MDLGSGVVDIGDPDLIDDDGIVGLLIVPGRPATPPPSAGALPLTPAERLSPAERARCHRAMHLALDLFGQRLLER